MHAPTPTYLVLLRLGFFVTAALVTGLALFPYLTLPEPAITRGFTDKIYHVVGCAVLVILAVEGWSLARRLAILALPLSFLLEWVQALVPGRGVHIADSVANIAGVSVALVFLVGFGRLTISRSSKHVACQGGGLPSQDQDPKRS